MSEKCAVYRAKKLKIRDKLLDGDLGSRVWSAWHDCEPMPMDGKAQRVGHAQQRGHRHLAIPVIERERSPVARADGRGRERACSELKLEKTEVVVIIFTMATSFDKLNPKGT